MCLKWDGRHYKWFHASDDSEEEDFDSEDYITDEPNGANEHWRQRRSYRDDLEGDGTRGVRRSPRLAARATSQTSRRTSQRQTANRRPN